MSLVLNNWALFSTKKVCYFYFATIWPLHSLCCFKDVLLHSHFNATASGPTNDMVDDFWTMVWQQDCGKIVMLTNLKEENKVCKLITKSVIYQANSFAFNWIYQNHRIVA